MNAGQLETEVELQRLETELKQTYKQARDEIQKKLDDYLKETKTETEPEESQLFLAWIVSFGLIAGKEYLQKLTD